MISTKVIKILFIVQSYPFLLLKFIVFHEVIIHKVYQVTACYKL